MNPVIIKMTVHHDQIEFTQDYKVGLSLPIDVKIKKEKSDDHLNRFRKRIGEDPISSPDINSHQSKSRRRFLQCL